eukprot:g31508.t1
MVLAGGLELEPCSRLLSGVAKSLYEQLSRASVEIQPETPHLRNAAERARALGPLAVPVPPPPEQPAPRFDAKGRNKQPSFPAFSFLPGNGHLRAEVSSLSPEAEEFEPFNSAKFQGDLTSLQHGANTELKLIHCVHRTTGSSRSHPDASASCESGPYDLLVIPEERIKREMEYFTITPSGVVHMMPGQPSECIRLSEWVHQCMMYRVLKSMSFFRLYVHRKAMLQWRRNARDASFCRKRARLARGCFFTRPMLAAPMLRVKALTSKVGAQLMLSVPERCLRLDEFESIAACVLEALVASIREGVERIHLRRGGSSFAKSRTRSLAQEKLEAKDNAELTRKTMDLATSPGEGHRVLDAAAVWLREGSRDGKRVLDRKNMNSTYGGSLSARSMEKISDPARKIVVASGALTARERKHLDLLQSMAAKAAQRFPSMSDVFRGLDPDRDGKIDQSELRYFFRLCGQTDVVADRFWRLLDRDRSEFLDYDLLVSFMRPFLVAAYSGTAKPRPQDRSKAPGREAMLNTVKEDFEELLLTRAFFRCFNLDGEEVDEFHEALAQIGNGEVTHQDFNDVLEDCFVREPDYGSFRIPQKKPLVRCVQADEVEEVEELPNGWAGGGRPEETLFSFKRNVETKLLKEIREVMRDIGYKVRMSYKRPRDALRGLDVEKDGVIRRAEMRDFFRGFNKSEAFADQVFDLLDPERTGKVDFGEFLAHFDEAPVIGLKDLERSRQVATVVNAIGHRMLTKYKNARQAFRDLDMDKDGKVCRQELRFFLRKMGLPVEAADVLFEALSPTDFGGLIEQETFVSLFLDLRGDLRHPCHPDEFGELYLRIAEGSSKSTKKLFVVTAQLADEPGKVLVEPSAERLVKVFSQTYQDLLSLADAVPQLVSAQSLWPYRPNSGGQSVRRLLGTHRAWSIYVDSTLKQLSSQQAEATRLAEVQAVTALPEATPVVQPEALKPAVKAEPAPEFGPFSVQIPMKGFSSLGLLLDFTSDVRPMVKTVEVGAVEKFNKLNPSRSIQPYDVIVALDEAANSSEIFQKMEGTLSHTVNLKLVRPKKQQEALCAGDRILAVNGREMVGPEMLEQIKATNELMLTVLKYEPFRKIFEYQKTWHKATLAELSIDALCKEVERMEHFQELLQKFRAQRPVERAPALLLEGRQLRELLQPVPWTWAER